MNTFSLTGAARAYRSGASLPGETTATPSLAEPAARPQSFGDLLAEAAAEAVQTVRTADAMGQAGLMGRADPQAVVEATLAMETTLKTVVAVRDKLVSAYQDVLRMPI